MTSELELQISDAARFIASGETELGERLLLKTLKEAPKDDKWLIAKIQAYLGLGLYRRLKFKPACNSLGKAISLYKSLQKLRDVDAENERKAGTGVASIYAEYIFCKLKAKPSTVNMSLVNEAVDYARNFQKNPVRRAATLDQLSNVLFLIGSIEEAIKLGEEAGKLADLSIGSNPPAAQICQRAWQRTAELLVMKKMFNEAMDYYSKMEEISQISAIDIALARGGKALCLRNMERYEEAYHLLEKAEKVLFGESKGQHPNLPFIYHLLGECAMKRASKYVEAKDLKWKALVEKTLEWCAKCENYAKQLGQTEVISQTNTVRREIKSILSTARISSQVE